MKKVGLLALVVLLAFVAFGTTASAGGRSYRNLLLGMNVVPGPGDPDGSGVVQVTLNAGRGEVCYELSVMDIELPATGAAIHYGPAGETGPALVTLTPPNEAGYSAGCVQDLPRGWVQDMIQNPANYYVSVQTSDYPDGAIRGQLSQR